MHSSRMVQIKVFDEEHEDDLTEVVNAWLQEHADIRLMDIKFSTAVSDFEEEQIYCFSAMVIFST